MLILLAIICIVFLAYATSFDTICEALPRQLRDMAQNTCQNRAGK
jgi:hypothetical protein